MVLLTIFLFLSGIISFFVKSRYITITIILALSSQYFLLADPVMEVGGMSIQHSDFGLLLIFILLPFRDKRKINELSKIETVLFLFLVFLLISILYDLAFRGTSYFQVFRTIRKTFFLFFFLLINSFSKNDFLKSLNFIFQITLVSSILYICQYIFKTAILPGTISENEFGDARYGNVPLFLIPITIWSLIHYPKKRIPLIIFIIAIILSQSRGGIIALFFILFIHFSATARTIKYLGVFVILLPILYISLISLFPIIGERFSHLFDEIKISSDLNFDNLNAFYHGGSFIFRLGVTYERLVYVLQDPIKIMLGVGYVPDIEITNSIFILGTHSEMMPTGIEQFNSADILFPNIITRYGILGSIIFLSIPYFITKFAYKKRVNYEGKILFIYMISLFIMSLNSETFYNGFNFVLIFVFIGLAIKSNEFAQNNELRICHD